MKFITKKYRFLITFCRRRTTKYISPLTYFTLFKSQGKRWKRLREGSPKVIKKHPKGSPGAFRKSSKKSYPKKMKKVAGNRPKMKKLGSKMASEIFENRYGPPNRLPARGLLLYYVIYYVILYIYIYI